MVHGNSGDRRYRVPAVERYADMTGTFSITATTGMATGKVNAGENLAPSANGTTIMVPTSAASSSKHVRRAHLRVVR